MPRKNCRICDLPVTRSHPSIECETCHLLCHRDCSNLNYYSGPSVFSCCLQPQAIVHNPSNQVTASSSGSNPSITAIQTNHSDTTVSSPLPPNSSDSATSITAIPTSSLESGHINSRIKNSDTSSKRKHTSLSPPQQVNKLPRIRANHTLPETFPATTSNMSAPPAYFTDFVESNSARLTEILQAVIQGNLQNQREREEDRQDITALKAHNALSDRCEVVIFGLPINTSLTYQEAAQKLITSLSLPTSISELTFREWSVPIRNSNQNSTSTNSIPAPYKAFVIRFPNPYARDRLLESSYLLKSLKANDIFGEGGSIPVYVQPLWPTEVHNLFTLAVRASKNHNYARPIVTNLVVCLRENVRSRPIPIYSEYELYRILPPSQPNQPFQSQPNQTVLHRPPMFFHNPPSQQLYHQQTQSLWPAYSHLTPSSMAAPPFNPSVNQRPAFTFSSQPNFSFTLPSQPQQQQLPASSTIVQSRPPSQHIYHSSQSQQVQSSLPNLSTLAPTFTLTPSKTPPASLLFNPHTQPSTFPYQQSSTVVPPVTASYSSQVTTSHLPTGITPQLPLTSAPSVSSASTAPQVSVSDQADIPIPTTTSNSESTIMIHSGDS